MNMYRSMREAFRQEYKERSPAYKERLVRWGAEPVITRAEKPTNIARARELGYKAKPGIIIARVRVGKGRSKRHEVTGGRKPTKMGKFYSYNKSLQAIAEERVARKFSNCEVLNSYYVGDIGDKKFYEVIMLDRSSPSLLNDPQYRNILQHKGRAYRGLTVAGIRHRGMSEKGAGSFTARPSRRSKNRY